MSRPAAEATALGSDEDRGGVPVEPIEPADELLDLLEAFEAGDITVNEAADRFLALSEKRGNFDFAFESSSAMSSLFAELHRRSPDRFPQLPAPEVDPNRHRGGGREALARGGTGCAAFIEESQLQDVPFHLTYRFAVSSRAALASLMSFLEARNHARIVVKEPREGVPDWRVEGITPARTWSRGALEEWFKWLAGVPIPEGEGSYHGTGLLDAGAYDDAA